MTLDEAIKHAEEVAEENQRVVDTCILFDDVTIDMLYCDDTEVIEEHLANYQRCADEHRQLAEWLKDYKRLLEQQPGDCVSRKAMLNAITEIDNNVNMDIYTNEVREIIKALPPVTPTRKVGKWEYKQLGFRKYGFVCTSCGYAIHIGYEFNSMEEFKDMIETKLQNPHITKDKYCCKCGAEMVGTEND